jgi:hypothetical protein
VSEKAAAFAALEEGAYYAHSTGAIGDSSSNNNSSSRMMEDSDVRVHHQPESNSSNNNSLALRIHGGGGGGGNSNSIIPSNLMSASNSAPLVVGGTLRLDDLRLDGLLTTTGGSPGRLAADATTSCVPDPSASPVAASKLAEALSKLHQVSRRLLNQLLQHWYQE